MSAVPISSEIQGFSADQFSAHLSQQTDLPSWWLEAKKAAWNQFKALPMPARKDERWRFSNVAAIGIDGFKLAELSKTALSVLPSFSKIAEIIFSNGRVVSQTALSPELVQQGVIYCTLDQAVSRHSDLFQKYFQKHLPALGGDKFVALNTALSSSGVFLYVPEGVEIAIPFAAQHHLSGDNTAIFPHTLVALESGAKATLVEFFISETASSRQLASGVNDLFAGNRAQLNYIGAQRWSNATQAFQSNSIVAERDARILSLNLHLGGRQARHESHSRLVGPGAHSEMLALTIASGSQEFDQRTLQTHQAPNTSSNLLYKNVLLEKSKTIFSGLIVVEPDAQKTDAYQSNRNLMLSDEAEANALPGLEIQANDVRCTHGATTSRIPQEQEFYLLSRGIRPSDADELLVFGFFEEVLAKLEDESLHAALRDFIAEKFTLARAAL